MSFQILFLLKNYFSLKEDKYDSYKTLPLHLSFPLEMLLEHSRCETSRHATTLRHIIIFLFLHQATTFIIDVLSSRLLNNLYYSLF